MTICDKMWFHLCLTHKSHAVSVVKNLKTCFGLIQVRANRGKVEESRSAMTASKSRYCNLEVSAKIFK